MPIGQELTRLHESARAAAGDDDARQTRMHGEMTRFLSDSGEAHRRDRDQAEPRQQRQRRVERVLPRPLEPFERSRIGAPGDDVERGSRQIDAVNLRLTMRPQAIAGVPQPPDAAGREAAGATRPLFGGVRRDALGLETVYAAMAVVSRNLVQTGIDDRGYARHRQRRFRDVGRDDDAATRGGRERAILIGGVERSVEGDDLDAGRYPPFDFGDCAADLRGALQKTEKLAVGGAQHICRGVADRLARRIADLERIEAARHLDHRAIVEKCRRGARVERRRHDRNAQIGARAPRLLRERDGDVGVDAPLVELVDHDRGELRQERIALQTRREDSFGDDEQARVGGELSIEANLPADFAAEGPSALGGNPGRNGARGDAARLQQDHLSRLDERRRHARRLTRARCRRDHRRARSPHRLSNRFDERIDRESDQ